MNKTKTGPRLNLIDTLRGLAIISMIIFHTVWIMNSFGYGVSTETLYGPLCTFWERTICMGFITISGFSFSLGRHHLKSGLLPFSLGLIITVVTCVFLPELRIIFGVLTFLGSACLIMILADKFFRSVESRRFNASPEKSRVFYLILTLVFLILFVFTYNLNRGYLGFGSLSVSLPKSLFKGYLMTFLGFLDPTFFSTDYFSLFPWLFLYFTGYFLHKLSRGTDFEKKVLTKGIPAISFLGRHSLIIYVVHPVVIFAVVYLISIK